jgi:hypothetical protein
MAASVRTLLKLVVGLFAALQAAVTPTSAEQSRPDVQSRGERLTMSGFILRLKQDAALRLRFSQNPRAVLHEHGIDPAPFNVPDRLDDAQIEQLLSDWMRSRARLAEAAPPPPPPPRDTNVPVPVYGPPPGVKSPPPPRRDPPRDPPPPQPPPRQP